MGRGRLRPVDLQVLASALAGDVLSSPGQACGLFGVGWPAEITDERDRIRQEMSALEQLYRRLVPELEAVAPGLPPDRVFSTGSLVSWALGRAKVGSLAAKASGVDLCFLGEMASAFYGGRIQALMPGIATSMALADISKTYASILSLANLGCFYGADHYEVEPGNPDDLRALLGSRAWRNDPEVWKRLGTLFVTVRPHG